jgi:hypothetical protein
MNHLVTPFYETGSHKIITRYLVNNLIVQITIRQLPMETF